MITTRRSHPLLRVADEVHAELVLVDLGHMVGRDVETIGEQGRAHSSDDDPVGTDALLEGLAQADVVGLPACNHRRESFRQLHANAGDGHAPAVDPVSLVSGLGFGSQLSGGSSESRCPDPVGRYRARCPGRRGGAWSVCWARGCRARRASTITRPTAGSSTEALDRRATRGRRTTSRRSGSAARRGRADPADRRRLPQDLPRQPGQAAPRRPARPPRPHCRCRARQGRDRRPFMQQMIAAHPLYRSREHPHRTRRVNARDGTRRPRVARPRPPSGNEPASCPVSRSLPSAPSASTGWGRETCRR